MDVAQTSEQPSQSAGSMQPPCVRAVLVQIRLVLRIGEANASELCSSHAPRFLQQTFHAPGFARQSSRNRRRRLERHVRPAEIVPRNHRTNRAVFGWPSRLDFATDPPCRKVNRMSDERKKRSRADGMRRMSQLWRLGHAPAALAASIAIWAAGVNSENAIVRWAFVLFLSPATAVVGIALTLIAIRDWRADNR
jgi:hypothetical protein